MEDHKPKKVLCFGLVMADVLVSGLERLPQNWEEAVGGNRSIISVGGGASNSARTFAKLGQPVDLLGRVGGDYFGEFVRRECENDGVNCTTLRVANEYTTGVAVGLVHKNGQRCFVTAQGANRTICREDFDGIVPSDYSFLHINGFFQFPGIEPHLRDILTQFRESGIPISLDLASSDPFGRWFSAIESFISCIDYFILNEGQLRILTGKQEIPDGAHFLMQAGVGTVIVKNGPEGCTIFEAKQQPVKIPTVPLPAVDTTGAGDSFDAAFVVGLLNGWDIVRAAQLANTVASMNCGALGATAGVPDYTTALHVMDEFYQNQVQDAVVI